MENKYPIEYNADIPEARLKAEQFYNEEFAKITDIARRHEVSQEKETWIGCFIAGYCANMPKLTPEQIEERKKAIEWYRNPGGEQVIEVLIPCEENDPRAVGGYTSFDGRSLCHVREGKVPVQQGAVWVKASSGLPDDNIQRIWKWNKSGNPEWKRIELDKSDGIKRWVEVDKVDFDDIDLQYLDESPTPSKGSEEWISVEDQLPFRDGDSSIYCLVNDTYDGIVVRPFNEAHRCWDQEDGDDYYCDARGGKITHWRPLPPPPKQKEVKP